MINTLNLILVFAVCIAVALFFYQLFYLTAEESMVISAVFVMIAVFFAGAIGNATYALYLFFLMAIAAIVLFICDISAVKHDKVIIFKRMQRFFNPSVLCMCLLFLYTLIAFRKALYTYPDEIAQWGPAVRYMAQTGRLPFGKDFSGQDITLSTATMFQYIWTALVPFTEKNTFIGNFLLAMIPIYLPFSGATWKEWKKILLYTVAVLLLLNITTNIKYYNLLQDHVLPLWTGSMIGWLLFKKGTSVNLWIYLGALACISPMKSMVGPLFAGILIVVLIVRQLTLYPPTSLRSIINPKVFVLTVLTLSSALGINAIWSAMIKGNVYNRFNAYDAQSKSLTHIVTGVFENAFNMPGLGKTMPNISFFVMFVLCSSIVLVIAKKFKESRQWKMITIIFALYAVGFFAYMLIMMIAYALIFGPSDSQIFGGLDRYYAYYIVLGGVPVITLLFIKGTINEQWHLESVAAAVLLIAAWGTDSDFVSKVTTFNIQEDSQYQERLEAKRQVADINRLTESKGKIYIYTTFSQNNSKVLGYELQERYDWTKDCYAMYYRSDKKDLHIFCDIIKYPQLLQTGGYDYLWCYASEDNDEDDKRIAYRYGLSEITDGAFYKINYLNGEVELKHIGNVETKLEEEESERSNI